MFVQITIQSSVSLSPSLSLCLSVSLSLCVCWPVANKLLNAVLWISIALALCEVSIQVAAVVCVSIRSHTNTQTVGYRPSKQKSRVPPTHNSQLTAHNQSSVCVSPSPALSHYPSISRSPSLKASLHLFSLLIPIGPQKPRKEPPTESNEEPKAIESSRSRSGQFIWAHTHTQHNTTQHNQPQLLWAQTIRLTGQPLCRLLFFGAPWILQSWNSSPQTESISGIRMGELVASASRLVAGLLVVVESISLWLIMRSLDRSRVSRLGCDGHTIRKLTRATANTNSRSLWAMGNCWPAGWLAGRPTPRAMERFLLEQANRVLEDRLG